MKENILKQLASVSLALNNVEVKGVQNMDNLRGSIACIENLISTLGNCTITSDVTEADDGEG